jgi:hypothetical protein
MMSATANDFGMCHAESFHRIVICQSIETHLAFD